MLADVLSWFFVLPSLSCTICFHTAFTLKVEVAGFLKTKLHGVASWKTVIIMFIPMRTSNLTDQIHFTSVTYIVQESSCLYQNCCFAYDKHVFVLMFASSSVSPENFMAVPDSCSCMVWFSTVCLCTLSGTALKFAKDTVDDANTRVERCLSEAKHHL